MNIDRINLLTKVQDTGYDSISYYKNLILDDIKKDSDLLELFNNPELSVTRPEDFVNTNILSVLKIPHSQSVVKNFLCFELDELEAIYGNNHKASYELTFRCVCHEDEVETPWGINRHDLMAAIIKDRFCYSNILGPLLTKTMDKGYVAENTYYYRVLKFQTIQNNDLRQVQRKNMLDSNRGKYANA